MKKFLLVFVVIAVSLADENLNKLCDGVLFESRSHPDDNHLFIGCIKGKAVIFNCDGNDEIFDKNNVSCVKKDNPCNGTFFGHIPHETYCDRFINCIFGIPIEHLCEENNVFDPEIKDCAPGDAETCEVFDRETTGQATEGTTRTPATTTTRTTRTTTVPKTKKTTVPTTRTTTVPTTRTTTVPKTRTATQRTTITTRPTTTRSTLSSTTTSSAPLVTTTLQEEISKTTTHSQIQSTTNDPITTTTRWPHIDVRFVCPTSGFGNIPREHYCDRYYECIQGIQYPRFCPDDEIFNVITSECGDPKTSLCADIIQCV
jgi:hypothetical protein